MLCRQVDALKRTAQLDRAELDERDDLIGVLSKKLKSSKEKLRAAQERLKAAEAAKERRKSADSGSGTPDEVRRYPQWLAGGTNPYPQRRLHAVGTAG